MKQNQNNVQMEVAKDKVDLNQFAVVNSGKDQVADDRSEEDQSTHRSDANGGSASKNGLQKIME